MDNIFQIACNMHKARYDTLSGFSVNVIPRHANIFINVDSIIRSWLDINKEDITGIKPEFILSELLAVVGHYKRYFTRNYPHAKICVMCYIEKDNDEENLRIQYITRELNELASVIFTYIPNVYWIICDYPSEIFAYSEIQKNVTKSLTGDRVSSAINLIVSDNVLDYYSISLDFKESKSAVGVFRRRKHVILNSDNIWGEYLMPGIRLGGPYTSGSFEFLFPRSLLAYQHKYFKEKPVSNDIMKYYRKEITGILKANDVSYTAVTIAGIKTFEETCDDRFELRKVLAGIDVSSLYKEHAGYIDNQVLLWKHDRLDYTIEKLNQTVFKSYPVDFLQVM
jgi:hypothetical protein